MKISQKRQTELYVAIADPITDLRVSLLLVTGGQDAKNRLDDKLFELQNEIWSRVEKVLNIQ